MFYELLLVGDDVECGLLGWTVTTSVTSPSSLHPNPSHAVLLQQLPLESSRRLLTTLLLVDPGWGDKKLDLLIKFIFVHRVERGECAGILSNILSIIQHLIFGLRIIDVQCNEL